MRIGKSGCVESDRTHYCIEKFNVALSLYKVLEVTFYFSKNFLEVAAKASQFLRVAVVYFLGQKFNLQSFTLQQKHKLFLRYFLHLSLINLLLLASLEERSTYGKLDYFLKTEDRDSLEKNIFVDKTTRDKFALFWKAVAGPEVEAFPCF